MDCEREVDVCSEEKRRRERVDRETLARGGEIEKERERERERTRNL